MTGKKIHWDLLRRRLFIPAVCTGIAAALVFYSSARFNAANTSYENSRQALNKFARDYQTAVQEEKLYKAFVNRFEDYSSKGYIGKEQRLEWIETLQDINRSLKLPILKYALKARKELPLSTGAFNASDKITVYETEMHLDIGLLHAGDLYVFLAELENRASGLFEVRACEMMLATSELQLDGRQHNIRAECQLSWYTIGIEAAEPVVAQ